MGSCVVCGALIPFDTALCRRCDQNDEAQKLKRKRFFERERKIKLEQKK